MCLEMAHPQVVAAVEHAAEGVATTVDHISVTLGGGNVHHGAVKALGELRLGRLGAKVAQKDRKRVDTRGASLLQSREHIGLGLDGALDLDDHKAALGTGGDDSGAATLCELDGEAVARDGDDAELDGRQVGRLQHGLILSYCGHRRCALVILLST